MCLIHDVNKHTTCTELLMHCISWWMTCPFYVFQAHNVHDALLKYLILVGMIRQILGLCKDCHV